MRVGEGGRLAAAAQAHPQCADQADEVREATARATNTTTTRRTRFPARTISRKRSAGRRSTIRPSAASSARSGSGWTTGPSCARQVIMSRRVKRPLAEEVRSGGDQARTQPRWRAARGVTSASLRVRATDRGGKSGGPRFGRERPPTRGDSRRAAHRPKRARSKAVEPPPLPTKVQTVVVTADENNMRVDRFLEARFPGLSFSHIQRIVRKGELRVNGKRADSKDRLEEGQSVRIPPLQARHAEGRGRAVRSRDKDARCAEGDDAVRGRRRDGAEQAGGSCGAGRLRH